MRDKNLVVYGIYSSHADVERGVKLLQEKNFRREDISVLMPEPESTHEFAHKNTTKAPEGTVVGGASGAIVGATLGWLAGTGLVAIPGVGPLIAAGPIMAIFAGVGAGSIVGGLVGCLVGMGLPEYEAKRYAGRIKDGGILISVHADDEDWRERAWDVLEDTGAEDIAISSEARADYEEARQIQDHYF